MLILKRKIGEILIRIKPAGGNKMKSLIVLAVLLMGFTALASPQVSYAQAVPGTLDDCIDSFNDLLTMWDSETVSANRSVVCNVNAGKARVALGGKFVSDTNYARTANSRLIRGGKNKFCNNVIFRQEDSPSSTDIGGFKIRGKDAAAWNRFLKGPGCQDAMALMP
jgi:hypothetical protein